MQLCSELCSDAGAENECTPCYVQVINAYMSLLSTRNMMRHFKHEQELAIVAESDVGEGSKPRTRRSPAIKNSSEHAESTAPLKCVFFSSFFYAILCNAKGGYNFQSVRRWSRKKVCGCVYAGELVYESAHNYKRLVCMCRLSHE